MSWPKEQYIEVDGFPRVLLKYIKTACEVDEVTWLEDTFVYNGNYTTGMFKWCECIFWIGEINESVRQVRLIEGVLDNEDLTAAILRG